MARAPVRVALGRRGADGAAAVARDACLREGDAPRAGLERREDLVLASKRGPEVRAARR